MKYKEYDFKLGDRVYQKVRGSTRKVNPGTIYEFGVIVTGSTRYTHRYARLQLDRGPRTALMLSSLTPLIENLNPNTKTL
jgi:hypothetical protein